MWREGIVTGLRTLGNLAWSEITGYGMELSHQAKALIALQTFQW